MCVSIESGASLSAQWFQVVAAAPAAIATSQSENLITRKKEKKFLQLLMRANKNELCWLNHLFKLKSEAAVIMFTIC